MSREVAVGHYLAHTNINLFFFSLAIINVFLNQYTALCLSGSNISTADDSLQFPYFEYAGQT